jgi:hypothetical protein
VLCEAMRLYKEDRLNLSNNNNNIINKENRLNHINSNSSCIINSIDNNNNNNNINSLNYISEHIMLTENDLIQVADLLSQIYAILRGRCKDLFG